MIKKFPVLFIAMALISALAFAQNESVKQKAPLKIEPMNVQTSAQLGTDTPVLAANYVAVDTMQNTFGPASATLNPVAFDPWTNFLAVVHRGNSRTYALGSGELWWNTSTDMGASWVRSLTSVQNNTTSQILARYPNMTIFNPTMSANVADTWGCFSWPELATSFAYLGYGVTLDFETSAFAEIDFDPPTYGSNVPTFSDDQYIYWVTDNQDNNSIRLFRTEDYSVIEKIDPPTWNDTMFVNGNITMGAVAYNGVLYHGVTASFLPVIGLGGWEVGYSKSTDHGDTWSDWFIPDWHPMTGLETYEELWDWKKDDAFVSYAGDIQVDKDGLVHLLVGLTDLADSADERGYNAVVEFFETSEGVWDYKILAEGFEDVNDLSLYEAPDFDLSTSPDDPAVGQNGPSFMIATNMDRDFFVAQWVMAPYDAVEDTIPCDIWYQTRALTDPDWSARTNLTETVLMNEDGAHLAPYLATVHDGAGTFTDYAFSMFWYEAGQTGTYVSDLNATVVYIAPVAVRTGPSGVSDDANTISSFELAQNYPNPFNPSTSIRFTLPERELVSLKVYDVLGNEVTTLLNETREAGLNTVNFSAVNLASGMYFYTIKAGNFSETKKMMLLK